MSATTPSPRPALGPFPAGPAAWTVVALAGLLTAAFYALFWHEWRSNPDLAHGIFAPVLFLVLLYESRSRGPWRYLPDGPGLTVAILAALAAGLGLLTIGGLYAAAVDWSHALVGFVLASALSTLLLASLLWLAGERVRALPFNWPALVAISLWPLSAPIPPGTYTRLTVELQLWVTGVVLHSLHFLGIPALQNGNVIQLATGSVGVEEACSGVRSLVSCIVAGLFFSATLVRRPAWRVVLLVLVPPLAIGMNFVRSLALTLLANDGVSISGAWHDYTGFAVLGLTAVMLGGLALWFEDRRPGQAAPPPAGPPAPPRPWLLPAGLGLAVALVLVVAGNTHASRPSGKAVPDLSQLCPAESPGWQSVSQDLYRFTATLQTDHLLQRTFLRQTPQESVQITVYIAYWPPGQVPVSLVASHTPEACWPGSGFVLQPGPSTPPPLVVAGRTLPLPESRLFLRQQSPQYVWYWHLYDSRPITQSDPRSALELLRLAWRYGFRTAGDQMFVRISSNQPWDKLAQEPLLVDLFARLQPFGL